MSPDNVFSELQLDLLKEAFNLGIGNAANALSKMVKQEVLISVPKIDFQSLETLTEMTKKHSTIVSVVQHIKQPFAGESILLFPEENSLEVVRCMLDMGKNSEVQSILHEEAVTEIGNIILNACVGAMAKAVNMKIELEIPHFIMMKQDNLLSEYKLSQTDKLLMVDMSMTLKESQMTGYLVFLFGNHALQGIRNAVEETLSDIRKLVG